MTHSTEIDAKNGYQFLTRLTCSVMPVFLQHQFLLSNRTCSIFVPVLWYGFSAQISGMCVTDIRRQFVN